MNRILWTGIAVAAFAVPAGIASAQTDDSGVEDETTTTLVCDGDQLRQQLHDGSGGQARSQQRTQALECDDCDQAMIQRRVREQVQVEDGTGDMTRERARSEDCDTCDGDQLREHQQLHDGSGSQTRQGGQARQGGR